MDKENKTETKSEKKKTNAEKIWEEIKDREVNMFALPGQKINTFCSPVVVEPSKVYLTFTVTSFLPALETALGPSYKVEMAGRFLTVSYATNPVG
jgi:hypothetical protein